MIESKPTNTVVSNVPTRGVGGSAGIHIVD